MKNRFTEEQIIKVLKEHEGCRANDRANPLRHRIAINDENTKTNLFQYLSFSLQPHSYIV